MTFLAENTSAVPVGSLAASADTPIPATNVWTDVTGASVSLTPGLYVALGAVGIYQGTAAAAIELRLLSGAEEVALTDALVGPTPNAVAAANAVSPAAAAYTVADQTALADLANATKAAIAANTGRATVPIVAAAFYVPATRTLKLQARTAGGGGTMAVKAGAPARTVITVIRTG